MFFPYYINITSIRKCGRQELFLPVNSVGVMGDERTYEMLFASERFTSTDGMTADWAHLAL